MPGADMSSNQLTQYLRWMYPGVNGAKTQTTIRLSKEELRGKPIEKKE